ncbi:hypothetical protein KsCSTR_03980 [Candidatus Kuenenia stuttgartiensis]|uniref:Uncharacterized protein n=1 Tax=Kuenenia stuttgartiensis TaxID=174633 RepID=Q1PXS5_KUEST|nr:hypothetical protein KsCSTR_03980 [Candidatus Kuenenia stuttgartiensis]CAJ72838.1 unknown protein [Candidatus Kuenenia stuttgartiensis]
MRSTLVFWKLSYIFLCNMGGTDKRCLFVWGLDTGLVQCSMLNAHERQFES